MGFLSKLFVGTGNTLEDAARLQDEMGIETAGADESSRTNAAARLMTARKFDECIAAYEAIIADFPHRRGDAESQIGAAYYFKSDYIRAIEMYVSAREHGADSDMMDDNIWEAVETLVNAAKDADAKRRWLARYLELCPRGKYQKYALKGL